MLFINRDVAFLMAFSQRLTIETIRRETDKTIFKLMKIKLLAAAMASLMVFASCVKDIESASVTNVRNAKAAELNSIAAYNNALAEAAVITANAEAALKAAQAEYEKAQAELVKAQAELLKVQTEEERTRLELLIVELETAKARSAAELERIAREMELELEQHKLALLRAQQQYNEFAQQLEEQERAHLLAVSSEFTLAAQELIELQVEKVELEASIASLEAGIKNAEEALEQQIEVALSELQYIDAQIENYKKYLTADLTELINALNDAYFKYDQATIAKADAATILSNTETKRNEAWNAVVYSKYNEGFSNLRNYAFSNFADDEGMLYGKDGKVGYYKDGITFVPLFKYSNSKDTDVVYNGYVTTTKEYTPAEVYRDGFLEFLDAKAAAAIAKNELTVKNLTADKESSQATADAYKKRMDDAYPESLQKEIKEAYDKATEEIEEAEKAASEAWNAFNVAYNTMDFNEEVAYSHAYNAYVAAYNEWKNCKSVLNTMPGEIANDKNNLEWAKITVSQDQGYIDNTIKPALEKADSLVEVYTAKVDSVANVIAAFKLEEKEAAMNKALLEYYAHMNDKDGGAAYWQKYIDAEEAYNAVIDDENYQQAVGEKQNFQNTLDWNLIPTANSWKQQLVNYENWLEGDNEWLATCTTTLEEHEAALAKAELEIEGLESKLELAIEDVNKVIEAEDEIFAMWNTAMEADTKVNTLFDERDAIAVYRPANIYHISEKYCYMEDYGDYRDIYCTFVSEVIEILLPGNNLWDDNARSSYISAFNTCSWSLAYVEVNEKGLELEKAETEKDFAQINDELAIVNTCRDLWDSHLDEIDKAKAVQEEYISDWKAWVDASNAATDAQAEYWAISDILDHDGEIYDRIDELYAEEDAIVAEINEMIDILNDNSKALAILKAKLPVLEAKITVQEQIVAALEAELNALLEEIAK